MTNNKKLLTKLVNLNVLKADSTNSLPDENSIVITKYDDSKEKINLNSATNEELLLMIEAEKLTTLKSIKNMIQFFVISTLIGAGIWLLNFITELASHL